MKKSIITNLVVAGVFILILGGILTAFAKGNPTSGIPLGKYIIGLVFLFGIPYGINGLLIPTTEKNGAIWIPIVILYLLPFIWIAIMIGKGMSWS